MEMRCYEQDVPVYLIALSTYFDLLHHVLFVHQSVHYVHLPAKEKRHVELGIHLLRHLYSHKRDQLGFCYHRRNHDFIHILR